MPSLWNGNQPLFEAEKKAQSLPAPEPQGQLAEHLRQLQRAWREARAINEARKDFALISGLLPLTPKLATGLLRACEWVENFVQGQKPLPALNFPEPPERPTPGPDGSYQPH